MNWLNNLSITRKIMLALIIIGLLPAIIVSVISNMQAERILADEASATLQAVRDNRKRSIESYMESLSAQVSILAQEPYITRAMKAFSSEFNQLESARLPLQSESLQGFYTDTFAARFKQESGNTLDVQPLYTSLTPAQKNCSRLILPITPMPLGKKIN